MLDGIVMLIACFNKGYLSIFANEWMRFNLSLHILYVVYWLNIKGRSVKTGENERKEEEGEAYGEWKELWTVGKCHQLDDCGWRWPGGWGDVGLHITRIKSHTKYWTEPNPLKYVHLNLCQRTDIE